MHTDVKKTISAKAQKLKGKAQEAIGEFQIENGQVWKGGISKAKGKLNQTIADFKSAREEGKSREEFDPDNDRDEVLI